MPAIIQALSLAAPKRILAHTAILQPAVMVGVLISWIAHRVGKKCLA